MKTTMNKPHVTFFTFFFMLLMIFSCDSSDDDNNGGQEDDNGDKEEVQIYEFSIGDTSYEFVALNLTWTEAAAYAVEKGGELADITSAEEQEALFEEIVDNSNFVFANTIALESNTAKVWIGGSDESEEGKWIWDGDNDGEGVQFFQGDFFDGGPVDDQYTNWGSGREPDNFGNLGQHALAIGITDWVFGEAGEWNDLRATNSLYFIIEYK